MDIKKYQNASKALIEMCSNEQPPRYINVGGTVWEDPTKQFMCGILDLEEGNDDYTEWSYGSTIEDAILNFYQDYNGTEYNPQTNHAVAINDYADVIGDENCEDFYGQVIGFREGFVLVKDQEDNVFTVDPKCVYVEK